VKICPTCSASYTHDVGFCPVDGTALLSGSRLEPGAIIRKKYEILSEIGRGGMGVVYRARHLIWNEEKALKVLAPGGAGTQQGLKGLMAEALVMRQLQHPHIVRVEDADYTEDDQPFVVMEFVDGQTLRQKLGSGGPLAPEPALQIAAQTCSALSVAHRRGIVHRDIKPQNLLLARMADGSETVKVIDFGIAKVREEAGLGLTGMLTSTTGIFVGTPGYASPEQANGMRGSDLDGRTDLYSLGLVLYEMLTGRLPFSGDTPFALLVQRLQVPPTPLDRVRPDLGFTPQISNLVMKALAKERENRFQSAEEMERAIRAVLDEKEPPTLASLPPHEPVGRPGAAPKKSAAAVLDRPESSRRWRAGSVVLLAALVLAGLAFFVSRSFTGKPNTAIPGAAAPQPQPVERKEDKPPVASAVVEKPKKRSAPARQKTAADIPQKKPVVASDSPASVPARQKTAADIPKQKPVVASESPASVPARQKTAADIPQKKPVVASESPASAPPFQSPSFDCGKAHTSVEQLICRDGHLASLEREMVSSFAQALKLLPDDAARHVFRQEHLAWFKTYSRTCQKSANDVDRAACIESFLSTHTTELKNRAAALPR